MNTNRTLLLLVASVIICVATLQGSAQSTLPPATSQPTPPSGEKPEPLKIFTEEVVIPIFAYDGRGRFEPNLEAGDFIVFEDDVMQQLRSVRRVPSSVLLLLDTAGEMNPAMKTNTTRDIAIRLISSLRPGDRVAAFQFGSRVEQIQAWTLDTEEMIQGLKTKLASQRRAHLAGALIAAAAQLQQEPAGSRHLVLITDGVETSANKLRLTEAITRLLDAQVIVHVISYGYLGRKTIDKLNPLVRIATGERRRVRDVAGEIMNPNAPSNARGGAFSIIIDTDFEMRRRRGEYKEATRESEQRLASLAEETGGLMLAPASAEEMVAQGEVVAREIDSQYVISYRPKRPLALATAGEYRRLKVSSRRGGVTVRTRRGYVARPQ